MDFTTARPLSEIAALLGATLQGDPEFLVRGINEIHMVRPGDLTFVDHAKYYKKALSSPASVILINKKVECPGGKHLLFSEDPFRDYNRLVNHFFPFQPLQTTATTPHPIVADSARVGEGTILAPGTVIGNDAIVGRNCIIHPHVVIYDRCVVGDRCVIHSNSVVGADAFYFKKYADGHYAKLQSCGRVIIGNDVEIGACCTIDRGVSGDTIISDGCKFDNHVHIGHDTYIGPNCLFAAHVAVAGVTRIEANVVLWGQVGVNKDLVIGSGAVVYAQSGVAASLAPGKTYFGSPAAEARTKMRELVWIKRLREMFEALPKHDK